MQTQTALIGAIKAAAAQLTDGCGGPWHQAVLMQVERRGNFYAVQAVFFQSQRKLYLKKFKTFSTLDRYSMDSFGLIVLMK